MQGYVCMIVECVVGRCVCLCVCVCVYLCSHMLLGLIVLNKSWPFLNFKKRVLSHRMFFFFNCRLCCCYLMFQDITKASKSHICQK